ncbi:winged helix-turn-helix transcriptional regulator [Sulfurospirillum sp. 1612]|uniref:winged helix-turn-helix transcriptional regulator n=1 Tax=Sulfurospirillum sp. 1612 TaxID=3094835 RepID=UPI002F95A14C
MSNTIIYRDKEYPCEFGFTLDLISGKWKGLILWYLQDGTLRYGALRKKLGNITQKMLTQTLRELERDKLISRKVYPIVPPKVEYTLTERGLKLIPIFKQLIQWGHEVGTIEGVIVD